MSLHRIKNCLLLVLLVFGTGLFATKAGADTTLSVGTATLGVTHVNKAIPASDTSIYVGDTVTQTYPCTLNTSGTNSSGKECTVDSANWTWSIVSVSYSRDGSTFYSDGYQPSIGGGSTGTMTAIFPNDVNHPPGFWKITIHVHVDIVSSTCPDPPLGQDIGPYGFSVAKGDFGISATLNPSTIVAGGSGAASVTVTPLAGFSGTVNLSLLGAPTGVTGDSFYVSPIFPNPVQRNFGIYVAETAIPGTYPMLVAGNSGVIGHSAPIAITIPSRTAVVTSGFGTTNRNDGKGNPVPNDPTVEVDTIINTAKIPPTGTPYIRERSGTYSCAAKGFASGFTYWWGSSISGSMGIDYPNCSSNWSAESTGNQTISVMSSSSSEVYPQTTTASCIVRNAGSNHSVTSNTLTVNWHWPFENLAATGEAPTPDPDTAGLEDVKISEITSSTSSNNPGYVAPNASITYVVKPLSPTVAWFYDNQEAFAGIAEATGNPEIAFALLAGHITFPTQPKDYTAQISDSASDLQNACDLTAFDEKATPAMGGDYRIDPPSDADMGKQAKLDPDPHVFDRFQSRFVHTLKIKRYVSLYHYKGDQYSGNGFVGIKKTDFKEETAIPKAVNFYKDVSF